MNINVSDKVVIITGGSNGIGKELVKTFAREKCKVVFTYLRSEEKAKELEEEMKMESLCVEGFKVNNCSGSEINEFIKEVVRKYKKIDVLVNNAGFIPRGFFLNTSNEVMEKTIETNIYGTINYCKVVLRYMMLNKNGSIINITSVSSWQPSAGQAAYSLSKAAIESLTKTLAIEYGKYNIRINTIAPGLVDTDVVKSITEKRKSDILDSTPLGKNASPTDIANAAIFLSSEMASHITGIQLLVTGGRHLI
jgi:3-oxoacyl-[acyl-carrier protein] reductase